MRLQNPVSSAGFLALLFAAVACSGSDATLPDPTGGGGGAPPPGGGTVPANILAMEDQAHTLVNYERAAMSIAALFHDDVLRGVARAHSEDMVARDFFDHVNPDGDDPFDRMAAAGVTFQRAGENIAWNRGFADPAQTAVDGWMNSPGHRANILDDRFTMTGMGVAEKPDGSYYFTQVFTRPLGLLVLRAWIVSEDGEVMQEADLAGSSWSGQGF